MLREAKDIIYVPGKAPETRCFDKTGPDWGYACNRRKGHTGRHAFIWWHFGGRVRSVWGER